ncbi:hypothetical protein HPB50_012033 [Hyalomma asiaticum]|uniref:Uncharacterized protein n=1 Tax=Hyalomma asiaticum TaxID=266040 RepID=A0ACB7S4X5_HYAAI|nr:hypothetical protein HPB50_012033 [Hyalomma asiaticum]
MAGRGALDDDVASAAAAQVSSDDAFRRRRDEDALLLRRRCSSMAPTFTHTHGSPSAHARARGGCRTTAAAGTARDYGRTTWRRTAASRRAPQ